MQWCFILVVVSLVGSAGTVAAEPAPPLSLPAAVQEALAHNPELAAARARVEAATGRAQQTRLWPNPELELTAEDGPLDQGGFTSATWWAGLSQTVPFPGKKSLDARIGYQEISVAAAAYRAREIELARDVTVAFWRAAIAEKKVAAAAELRELAGALAAVTAKRVAAGNASEQERLRAEIEQDRAELALTTERRDMATSREELARLVGRPGGAGLGTLAADPAEPAVPADLAPWRAQMLAQHPTLTAALADRDRAELELRRARREPWPDVTVGVAAGRDRREDETLVALRLTVPLPVFDRAQGRQRETRALADLAGHDLATTEQRLLETFGALAARLGAARDQVAAYRERILPRAEKALALIRAGFEAGKFGFLDLADTQRTLAEARLGYLDNLLELNVALADLAAVAGATDLETGTNKPRKERE